MNRISKKFYKSPEVIRENIEEIWQQTNYSDLDNGKDWYKEANKFSLDISNKFDVTPVVSAGVISALSPLKSWEINKKITEDFFERSKKAPMTAWRKTPHYYLQKRKAFQITRIPHLSREGVISILNGLKTINFFKSILNPLQSEGVCIDSHMIMIAMAQERKKVTNKQYLFLQQEYLKFAEDNKLMPCEAQATLWLTYKRVKKL